MSLATHTVNVIGVGLSDWENIYPHNEKKKRQVSLFEQYKLDNNIYELKERQLLL